MASRDEILKLAVSGQEHLLKYFEPLSLAEIKSIKLQLTAIATDLENLREGVMRSLSIAEHQIEKKEASREKQKKEARRKTDKTLLREFLIQPPLLVDARLDTLSLCTKSGAALLLDGLTFTGTSGETTMRTVNKAKELFVEGHTCWAGWDLHYVKDGKVSSGFGWNRPFLNEIFVLSMPRPRKKVP